MNQKKILIPTILNKIIVNALLETNQLSDCLVIIIPGTGPVDLDGNVKEFKTNIYLDISKKLHEFNISTLRYDKPGIGESSGNYNQIGLWDLVDTVSSLVNYFRQSEIFSFKKIILLGHSEGTIIATLVSNRIEVDGLILLGGAGSNLRTIMSVQNTRFIEEVSSMKGFKGFILRLLVTKEGLLKKQNSLFTKVEQSNEDFIKISGQVVQAKWLREHLIIDEDKILQILSKIAIPTLIIDGDKDVQIDSEANKKVAALNNPNLTIRLIDNMNHLLKIQSESISLINLKKIYKSLQKNSLSQELVENIKEWLNYVNKTEASNV